MMWLFLIPPKKSQTRNGRALILERFLGREVRGCQSTYAGSSLITRNAEEAPQGFEAAAVTARQKTSGESSQSRMSVWQQTTFSVAQTWTCCNSHFIYIRKNGCSRSWCLKLLLQWEYYALMTESYSHFSHKSPAASFQMVQPFAFIPSSHHLMSILKHIPPLSKPCTVFLLPIELNLNFFVCYSSFLTSFPPYPLLCPGCQARLAVSSSHSFLCA